MDGKIEKHKEITQRKQEGRRDEGQNNRRKTEQHQLISYNISF